MSDFKGCFISDKERKSARRDPKGGVCAFCVLFLLCGRFREEIRRA